jgi:O-antigen ligase
VWLTVQAAVLVVVAAWCGGGRFDHAPALLLAVGALGLPLLAWHRAQGAPVRWAALAPALAWAIFTGLAALNPSHAAAPDGTWVPRTGWIAWLPTTVDRTRLFDAAWPWFTALWQGGVLVATGWPRRAVRRLWAVVALNGFGLAVVGAGFRLNDAEKMLGQFAVPEPTYFFATFFYKNHWAAWGALSAVAGGTLALVAWRRATQGDLEARGRAFFFGGLTVLTLCTLPLPGSRAGALLALGIGAALLARAWFLARRPFHGRGWALGAAVLVAVLGASFYAGRAPADVARTRAQWERHAAGGMLDLRLELTRDTARMAADRPVFGWGGGSYEIVFPLYQGAYLRDENGRPTARFEFAHNDWLQIAAEGGVVGALLLLGPAAWLWRSSWRSAHRTGRWALGGAALIALYAWIDFPFHNPAVLLLWTTLVATARGWRDEPAA